MLKSSVPLREHRPVPFQILSLPLAPSHHLHGLVSCLKGLPGCFSGSTRCSFFPGFQFQGEFGRISRGCTHSVTFSCLWLLSPFPIFPFSPFFPTFPSFPWHTCAQLALQATCGPHLGCAHPSPDLLPELWSCPRDFSPYFPFLLLHPTTPTWPCPKSFFHLSECFPHLESPIQGQILEEKLEFFPWKCREKCHVPHWLLCGLNIKNTGRTEPFSPYFQPSHG